MVLPARAASSADAATGRNVEVKGDHHHEAVWSRVLSTVRCLSTVRVKEIPLGDLSSIQETEYTTEDRMGLRSSQSYLCTRCVSHYGRDAMDCHWDSCKMKKRLVEALRSLSGSNGGPRAMYLKQLTIDRYETREKLVLSGVWGGEIYKTADLAAGKGRGWLWKTLVINGDEDVEEPVEVPNLEEDSEGSPPGRKVRVRKQKSIRRLTPVSVARHPLQNAGAGEELGAGQGDDMCLQEKLEIIDLDLSRLMLDDIFQEEQVHAEMRRILYNYLLRNEDDSSYKQGYHELLGMIYLQLYKDEEIDAGPERSKARLRNALCIFEKLMMQMSLFYDEPRLIKWDEKEFRPILEACCPRLYEIVCCDDNHTNILWLIRWTRLLFMRELPRDYTLIIWDHLLTSLYPLPTLIACLIVVLLMNNYKTFVEEVEDHNDLVELMLHFQTRITSMIDCVELCKMAGNLCELWYTQDFDSMKLICDNFLKIKFNIEKQTEPEEKMDPNRRRIEEKLRRRVKQTLLPKNTK